MTTNPRELERWPPGWTRLSVPPAVSAVLRRRRVRSVIKVLADAVGVALAVLVAVSIGGGPSESSRMSSIAAVTVILTGLTLTGIAMGKSYRSVWHFTGAREAAHIVAVGVLLLGFLYWWRGSGLVRLPITTIVQIPLLTVLVCVGIRILRRWQVEARKGRQSNRILVARQAEPYRVLIAGAGLSGAQLSRDILLTARKNVRLVGFLDDDPTKRGAIVHGAPVLGPLGALQTVVEAQRVDELLVAMPSAPIEVLRPLIKHAENLGIRVRAIPGVHHLVRGTDLHRPGSATLEELVNGGAPPKPRPVADDGRTILVTGGAGFIGSHLVRLLLERGYRVRVLDNFAYGAAGLATVREHPRLEILNGDICDMKAVARGVRNTHGVIALAAIVGDPACNLDPEETVNFNYQSTKILKEACTFYGVRRLVFASSCSVYGANSNGLLTERSSLNPVSLYARTRILSESILFDREGDVEPVVLRLATVFGASPRMRFDLVVNTLTARAVVDGKVTIFGGNQWRPHVHCHDAARAFVLALAAPADAVAGEVFNVGGSDLNMRILDLGKLVASTVGGAVEVVIGDNARDPRDYQVGFEKIRKTLGFVPERSLQDGIREVADAIRASRALQSYQDPVYHNVHALSQRMRAVRVQDATIPDLVA
jgi:nucleoside-diphosphate-sugar epimerase